VELELGCLKYGLLWASGAPDTPEAAQCHPLLGTWGGLAFLALETMVMAHTGAN